MTNEMKQNYTLRISQANKSQLVVILYEMFDTYMEDAIRAFEAGDYAAFRTQTGNAKNVIANLLSTLNYSYGVSFQLAAIYQYLLRELSRAVARKDVGNFERIRAMADSLKKAFEEAAKSDDSEPLMRNTQQVYAGLTYGRGVLTETFQEESSRGFFA